MSCKAEQLHTWCLCRGLWFMASNSILELPAKQINSCGFWLPMLHSIGFIIYIKYKEEFKAQISSRNILTCTWRWYLPVDLSIVFYGDRFLLFQGTVLAELIVTLDQQSWGNRESGLLALMSTSTWYLLLPDKVVNYFPLLMVYLSFVITQLLFFYAHVDYFS